MKKFTYNPIEWALEDAYYDYWYGFPALAEKKLIRLINRIVPQEKEDGERSEEAQNNEQEQEEDGDAERGVEYAEYTRTHYVDIFGRVQRFEPPA